MKSDTEFIEDLTRNMGNSFKQLSQMCFSFIEKIDQRKFMKRVRSRINRKTKSRNKQIKQQLQKQKDVSKDAQQFNFQLSEEFDLENNLNSYEGQQIFSNTQEKKQNFFEFFQSQKSKILNQKCKDNQDIIAIPSQTEMKQFILTKWRLINKKKRNNKGNTLILANDTPISAKKKKNKINKLLQHDFESKIDRLISKNDNIKPLNEQSIEKNYHQQQKSNQVQQNKSKKDLQNRKLIQKYQLMRAQQEAKIVKFHQNIAKHDQINKLLNKKQVQRSNIKQQPSQQQYDANKYLNFKNDKKNHLKNKIQALKTKYTPPQITLKGQITDQSFQQLFQKSNSSSSIKKTTSLGHINSRNSLVNPKIIHYHKKN